MNWYYLSASGESVGPVDDAEFDRLVRTSVIAPATLVWNETLTEWVAYGRLLGVPPPDESETAQPFAYDGEAGELFLIYLKNIALTLLTLGVYRFWAKVALRRYFYRHTTVHGGRFDYHATGLERFLGFLRALLFLSPAIFGLVVVYFLLQGSGTPGGPAFMACFYLFLLMMFVLRPLVMVGSTRFHLSRTSWNGMRFVFDGRISDAYWLYIRDGILMLLTCGLYGSWHHVNVRRFKAQHAIFGGERLDFHGSGFEYLALTLGGTMLTYITLGLFAPWYIAWITRFHIDKLSYQGTRFRSTLSGLDVLKVGVLGILATVLTLGLAFPWAMTLYRRTWTNSISYLGEVDIDALRGAYDARASALAEGIGEAGEALESLGELFGG